MRVEKTKQPLPISIHALREEGDGTQSLTPF